MGKKDKTAAAVSAKKSADVKAETSSASKNEEVTYETRLKAVSAIAHPLASKKLNKRVLKVVKKAAKAKTIKRGVKEVVKGLRKGTKGFVVLAGDISPIDVLTHLPVLCEDANVPYIYVPSKEELGSAGSTKRPTSCIMVMPKNDAEFTEAYTEVMTEVNDLNKRIITSI